MGKIKLGIIGLSEGNGHPYSWSAIFNGFNSKIMASCPFAVIPEYLNKRDFPNDFLTEKGIVTHIYTQDPKRFWVLMLFFLFTGIALKVYLNERPFEPRERDYALVGSFYVFTIWIGLGCMSLIQSVQR